MAEELRSMYERMKLMQDQETKLRKEIQTITKTKNEIKQRIESVMISHNIDRLEVRGTADSIEIVENKKYESLTKETIIRKILTFFERAGSTPEYQNLEPTLQARAVIHAVYTEREQFVVKKLKLKTDKNVIRVQQTIEENQQVPLVVPAQIEAPTEPSSTSSKIRRFRRLK
jgi:hypothetical protein